MKLTTLIAEKEVALWRCEENLGRLHTNPSVEPWSLPKSPKYRRWVLNLWTKRRNACTAVLSEWKRQWDWPAWLPDKWQRIGACETGYGKRPGNFRHSNSSYEGFAGFAKQSWDSFKYRADPKAGPYPEDAWQATPRQQYEVALAIWRAYGFSGWGCRNA